MSDKMCRCKEPLLKQSLPEGFKGKIRCAECDGIALIDTNAPKVEYEGDDEVEELLFNAIQRNQCDMEYGILRELRRISLMLEELVSSKKEPTTQGESRYKGKKQKD